MLIGTVVAMGRAGTPIAATLERCALHSVRMFALNSGPGHVASEQTHFEREENTLFASHRTQNFKLNVTGRVASVGDGQG